MRNRFDELETCLKEFEMILNRNFVLTISRESPDSEGGLSTYTVLFLNRHEEFASRLKDFVIAEKRLAHDASAELVYYERAMAERRQAKVQT